MIIPDSLKIGGHVYHIIRAPMPGKICAETDRAKRTITIDNELSGSTLDSTLLHEVLHCCNGELEHCLLDSLSEQLYQVLHDNSLLAEDENDSRGQHLTASIKPC